MVVERPSDREFACFFCGRGKTKDLTASCQECSKPIDVGPIFEQQRAGDYLLMRYVKRGFYGATYYGENRIRKPFAVKIIPQLLYSSHGKSFDEEIQKYRQLGSHPNIAELIDAGQTEFGVDSSQIAIYYIVTEWIDGQPLTDFIKKEDLSVSEMYGAILDISSGVARFENKNLWHNDLNSDNILVKQLSEEERETRRSESQYICKIVDIGSVVFRQPERHKILDDVKFLGLHINTMRNALLGRSSSLSKEDRYFLDELGKIVAHILDEDPARSVNRVQVALEEIKSLYARRLMLGDDDHIQLADPFAILNANDLTERYISLLFSDQFPWLRSIVTPEIQPMLIAGPRGSGKTMILKSMRLKTRMNKQEDDETKGQIRERLQEDRLAGFFVSARIDIGNNCPLTKSPRWATNEGLVNLYFDLLFTYEIIDSIHFGMITDLIDVPPEAERTISLFFSDVLNNGFVASFGGLLSSISQIQNQIIRDEYAKPVKPGIVGPPFLSRVCALLKEQIPFFIKKNIVFLLDDFSLPKVPESIQKTLLPTIWNSGGGYSFRVTAHSESVVREDLKGSAYLPNREYTEVNLGASYINNVDFENKLIQIRNCVDDILKKRFALNPSFPAKNLEQLLGGPSRTEKAIAEELRELSHQKKMHTFRYSGWPKVIKLCSGDISYIIDLLRRILIGSPKKLPVNRQAQNTEIRRYARNELYRLQDYSVSSCNLYEIAATFGKFSLFKLLSDEVGRGRDRRPAEYLRIEVEIDGLSPQAKQAVGDLLRNGVFIDGGFSSSAKGTPARRLIFKKFLTPVFPTTYNSRDTWPMSAAHFLEFINNPQQYVKRIMGEHGIPPNEQQLRLDNLMRPE